MEMYIAGRITIKHKVSHKYESHFAKKNSQPPQKVKKIYKYSDKQERLHLPFKGTSLVIFWDGNSCNLTT